MGTNGGSTTATDLETGLARGGDSRAEALAQLAEVLALHEGDSERSDDPDAFLQDELGIEPSDEDWDLSELYSEAPQNFDWLAGWVRLPGEEGSAEGLSSTSALLRSNGERDA
ncbi:type II toxin-antitoxin system HicB family antitoxin [Haloplanus natans]|uniref:type II toxin-antitoxin system HicB family antitoxin n=1 Tax=Haloplanus natans TaxID=376171 RepID=UPI001FE0D21B|nr:hypothetical protein [Haloplanus natans]